MTSVISETEYSALFPKEYKSPDIIRERAHKFYWDNKEINIRKAILRQINNDLKKDGSRRQPKLETIRKYKLIYDTETLKWS